jgi:hypothetical protein
MKISLESSETEWFLLPAVSLFDENWGRKGRKWALFIYWLNHSVEIYF